MVVRAAASTVTGSRRRMRVDVVVGLGFFMYHIKSRDVFSSHGCMSPRLAFSTHGCMYPSNLTHCFTIVVNLKTKTSKLVNFVDTLALIHSSLALIHSSTITTCSYTLLIHHHGGHHDCIDITTSTCQKPIHRGKIRTFLFRTHHLFHLLHHYFGTEIMVAHLHNGNNGNGSSGVLDCDRSDGTEIPTK
ncbi:hypothetical protein YC2023_106912 [Brassica napus]